MLFIQKKKKSELLILDLTWLVYGAITEKMKGNT